MLTTKQLAAKLQTDVSNVFKRAKKRKVIPLIHTGRGGVCVWDDTAVKLLKAKPVGRPRKNKESTNAN